MVDNGHSLLMVIPGTVVEMPAAFMFFAPALSPRKTDACFLDPSSCSRISYADFLRWRVNPMPELCGLLSVECQPNARHMTGDDAAGSTGAMDDVLE